MDSKNDKNDKDGNVSCKRNDYLSIYFGKSMLVCGNQEDKRLASLDDKVSLNTFVSSLKLYMNSQYSSKSSERD